MNSSMQSTQLGPKAKSPERPTESAESSGNKDTDVNPILQIDNPLDAKDMLNARSDLSHREVQHLCKVAKKGRVVGLAGKAKQDSDDYWARKYSEMTYAQLVRETKKVKTHARILIGRMRRIHKASIFAKALAAEQKILKGRVNALNEELIKRKEVANGRASL